MHQILCFGDSVTYGEKDLSFGGWVERLKLDYLTQYANSEFQKTFIFNLGVPSENTDGLVRRVDNEVKARVYPKQSNTAVLFYGLNDLVIHKNKNRVPLEYFRRNLGNAINTLLNVNARVVLINLPDFNKAHDGVVDAAGKLRSLEDIALYNDELLDLTNEFQLTLIDLNSAFKKYESEELFHADGVHPNSKGHEVIYQQVKHNLD
ncbi:MAG: GDSL-type esterase/lipase family protein [Kangiellaceae bacterium]|nr:GDSL-type esterase/lipase family protein [Kangiellaceae bacterium]MCW8998711.1 GDSL-type esterase/lipase family protein [Kangiellaceae bacterium]